MPNRGLDPTPQKLLEQIIGMVPDFRFAWEEPDNPFDPDDGSYTLHSVFCVLTWYLRSNFDHLHEDARKDLFEYVEQCVNTDGDSLNGVSNAACTCFLENLAGEGIFSDAVAQYLGPNSKAYFDQWQSS